MGNNSSTNTLEDFLPPVQELLRSRKLKVSTGTIRKMLAGMDQAAPWFAASGSLTIQSWEKLGKDLERAKKEGTLAAGTFPLWKMIQACLREGKSGEIIQRGRRALAAHQDSMSEGDMPETGVVRPRKKNKKKDGGPELGGLYPVLDEFKDLSLSQDELDSEEEADLEEEAARYEKERYGNGRPPPFNLETIRTRPSAPPAVRSMGGCRFIPREAWHGVPIACPVFENDGTRYHEPIDYKQLRDLAEAAKRDGITANYTIMLLTRFMRNALSPTDWQDIARACLSMGQYLDWKSILADMAHQQARENAANGQPAWTADMLLGQGQWANDQKNFPIQVYEQINKLGMRAWRALPNKGEVTGNLTKIIQGSTEPFSDFVARMMEAAGRVFGDIEQAMPLIKQLVFEQSTKECQRAISPWKNRDIEVWMKICREIGGPLTNAGLAAAVLAAARYRTNNGKKGVCFQCGKPGHVKKECQNRGKQMEAAVPQQARQPGTCPRCKKGKHWANECRSVRDINGQPIAQQPQSQQTGTKNGKQGPWSQGPKIYGAHEEVTLMPPRNCDEPRQAPQGWTSVPPPTWS